MQGSFLLPAGDRILPPHKPDTTLFEELIIIEALVLSIGNHPKAIAEGVTNRVLLCLHLVDENLVIIRGEEPVADCEQGGTEQVADVGATAGMGLCRGSGSSCRTFRLRGAG